MGASFGAYMISCLCSHEIILKVRRDCQTMHYRNLTRYSFAAPSGTMESTVCLPGCCRQTRLSTTAALAKARFLGSSRKTLTSSTRRGRTGWSASATRRPCSSQTVTRTTVRPRPRRWPCSRRCRPKACPARSSRFRTRDTGSRVGMETRCAGIAHPLSGLINVFLARLSAAMLIISIPFW